MRTSRTVIDQRDWHVAAPGQVPPHPLSGTLPLTSPPLPMNMSLPPFHPIVAESLAAAARRHGIQAQIETLEPGKSRTLPYGVERPANRFTDRSQPAASALSVIAWSR